MLAPTPKERSGGAIDEIVLERFRAGASAEFLGSERKTWFKGIRDVDME